MINWWWNHLGIIYTMIMFFLIIFSGTSCATSSPSSFAAIGWMGAREEALVAWTKYKLFTIFCQRTENMISCSHQDGFSNNLLFFSRSNLLKNFQEGLSVCRIDHYYLIEQIFIFQEALSSPQIHIIVQYSPGDAMPRTDLTTLHNFW